MNQKKTIGDLFQEFFQEFENRALEIGFDQFALEFCRRLTLLIRCIPLSKDSEREYILELKDRVLDLAKAIKEDKEKEKIGIDVGEALSRKRKEFIEIVSNFQYRDKKAEGIYEQYKSEIHKGQHRDKKIISIFNQYKSKSRENQKSFGKEKREASATGMNGGEKPQKRKIEFSYQIGATAVSPRWANPNTKRSTVGRNPIEGRWGQGQRDIVEEDACFYLEQLKFLEDNADNLGINKKSWDKIVDAIVNLEENLEKYNAAEFSASFGGLTQEKEDASSAKKQLKRNNYKAKKFLAPYDEILEAFKEKARIPVMQTSALGRQEYHMKQPSKVYSGRFDSVRPDNFQESEGAFGGYAQGR